jgi:hypothetical protein
MPQDERNLLEVLKAELNFLTKGGYGRSPREPWREPLFLEDSPSCMNYDSKENPSPCVDCLLMQFIPSEKRTLRIPCRHIPLTLEGETVQDLRRGRNQQEVQGILEDWLRRAIDRIEIETNHVQNPAASTPEPEQGTN